MISSYKIDTTWKIDEKDAYTTISKTVNNKTVILYLNKPEQEK
jgi:hypothetical protein